MNSKPCPPRPDLDVLFQDAIVSFNALPQEQKAAMIAAQALSWAMSMNPRPGHRQAVPAVSTKTDWVDRCAWIAAETLKIIDYPAPGVRDELGTSLQHQVWLLEQLRDRKVDGPTKSCRWLGWVQAALVFKGLMTLEQQKELNLASGSIGPRTQRGGSFQARSQEWLDVVTKDDPTDLEERVARFLEEALELAQSLGMRQANAIELVEYTFNRPAGEPHQEFGGMLTTAAVLAQFTGHDMMACGERELARVWAPEVIEKIRRKRATRHGRGVLPGVVEHDPEEVGRDEVLEAALHEHQHGEEAA